MRGVHLIFISHCVMGGHSQCVFWLVYDTGFIFFILTSFQCLNFLPYVNEVYLVLPWYSHNFLFFFFGSARIPVSSLCI